ncbi:MAG: hypothetical protein Q7R52_03845 [archaeon]|nr:hypothetical protein [archaeon]
MAEKQTIFSNKIKVDGVFLFKEFYKFCYDWIVDNEGFLLAEKKYAEKISGNSKNIDVEWEGMKKVTDYFRFDIKIVFKVVNLTEVEITNGNEKIKTNKGSVEIKVTGTLVRDYDGKFEKNAFQKFLRGVYEKYIIKARVDEFEGKLIGVCTEFLAQAKSYLDLEGKT